MVQADRPSRYCFCFSFPLNTHRQISGFQTNFLCVNLRGRRAYEVRGDWVCNWGDRCVHFSVKPTPQSRGLKGGGRAGGWLEAPPPPLKAASYQTQGRQRRATTPTVL